ncbi:S-methyl-5'-thioinosine phosphorylase [Congregibacter litoralis]|uniref:Probable S-methyl-5'-thioinosine phosphorylase n=1 Tax=Congregibacter litoralis KT71 TaxID=314285 RepID=A4A887_9GAMM|nr:S-methyl-5'-thioinosine phosphorylase [Congregibacter litoralis]EAQ97882.1 methylthioadenosine phosphorylase [Congregibacter litoralis KT71]
MSLGLIGGTGLDTLSGLRVTASHAVDTPYGQPSMAIEEGVLAGRKVFFLHRHGGGGRPIPPHRVNYRANLWALHELGVKRILAANAVGAIASSMTAGKLVIPHQLIDYTWGREHSFDDGSSGVLQHVDFTHPYDAGLREEVLCAARAAEVPYVDAAVLGVVQGPRLETAAEVTRFSGDGCDLLGMTGMPEASLARELGLPYAAICMVVNAAAGLGDASISMDAIRETLRGETLLFGALLRAFLEASA